MPVVSLSAAVGRRLKQLRLNAGVSRARIARKARLSATTLQSIEDGLTQPSLGTLSAIAGQLGTSVAEVVREVKRATVATSASDISMVPEQIGRAIVALPDGVDKLEVAEAAAIRCALELAKGNKSAAARLLGAQRQALGRRIGRLRVR